MRPNTSRLPHGISMLCVLFLMAHVSLAATIYVDADAPTEGDGISWTTPYKYLQDALLIAQDGDVILLGGGTYRPDKSENHGGTITVNNRDETFLINLNGLKLIGGFAGYDAPNDDGDAVGSVPSVLTGAIGIENPDVITNNSYHVVTVIGITDTANTIFERLTIRDGYAYDQTGYIEEPEDDECYDDPDAEGNHPKFPTKAGGGGMECVSASPTIRNVIFEYNYSTAGGGLRLLCNSSPLISLCTFQFNQAWAGVDNDPPTVLNWPGSGGGLYMYGACAPKIFNTRFTENHADHIGAAWRCNRTEVLN